MKILQTNKRLKEENAKLRWDNLRMRLELEILLDGTETKAARKILNKYRRRRDIRSDALLELQN